ncbi:MAG: DUF4126 domain-containing protein [Phormidesmis sp.]
MNALVSLCIGVGLSTSTGFRILVPFASLNAAALFGGFTLPPEMAWLNSYPAFFGLLIGTLIEVAAFYVPWVNDALDTVEFPAAVIAGTYLTGTFAADLPTLMQWSLAIFAGGGSAGAIQGLTSVTRLTSNTATGGCATPVTASVEWLSALVLAILSLTLPVLAIALVIIVVLYALRKLSKRRVSIKR